MAGAGISGWPVWGFDPILPGSALADAAWHSGAQHRKTLIAQVPDRAALLARAAEDRIPIVAVDRFASVLARLCIVRVEVSHSLLSDDCSGYAQLPFMYAKNAPRDFQFPIAPNWAPILP